MQLFFVCTQFESNYVEPDIPELNYHAGTASHSLTQCLITLHSDVQYFDDHEADFVTAIFLLISCINPNQDLSKVSIDYKTALECLNDFLNDININKSLSKCFTVYFKTIYQTKKGNSKAVATVFA